MTHRNPHAAQILGLFLISAATLLSEILWIRIFSASIWYHFAFLVVSFALLGFGIAGILLRLWPSFPLWRDLESASTLAMVFGCSLLVGYYVTNLVPFSPFSLLEDPVQLVILLVYYLVLSVPYLCMGLIVGLILIKKHRVAGLYYAFDLIGAGVGVVLFFFLIGPLSPGPALACAAGLSFLSALCFPTSNRKRTLGVALSGAAASVFLMTAPGAMPGVRTDVSKVLGSLAALDDFETVRTDWNRLSRVDVVSDPGGFLTIMIDGGASTPLSRGTHGELGNAGGAVVHSTALFALVRKPEIVIIGSGGGKDVRNALLRGARAVTGVEINPTIVSLARETYRDDLGGLFQLPQVTLVESEGRHFVRQRPGQFDAVQLTLIDTWAASASGAYSLSENYLYTVEAMEDYMACLRPDGVLSITRWNFDMPRLLSVVRKAMPEVRDRLVVVEQKSMATLLVKNAPLTTTDMDSLKSFCSRTGSIITCSPEVGPETNKVFWALVNEADLSRLYSMASINLHPATDDSPFFFQQAKWKNLNLKSIDIGVPTNALLPTAVPAGEIALLAVLVVSLFLSLVFLVFPMLLRKDARVGIARSWAPLLYFSGLGVAFIVLEVATMQRFGLYLGHPSYSIIVVLFAILVASGLGSLCAGRLVPGGARGALLLGVMIAGSILVHLLASQAAFSSEHAMGLSARIAVSVLLVSLPAFFMGMAFPAGVMAVGRVDPNLVSWGWAMNGAMSVVGSSLAVLGAMAIGFKMVVVASAGVYLVVGILMAVWLQGARPRAA